MSSETCCTDGARDVSGDDEGVVHAARIVDADHVDLDRPGSRQAVRRVEEHAFGGVRGIGDAACGAPAGTGTEYVAAGTRFAPIVTLRSAFLTMALPVASYQTSMTL